ncbi:uncharacterized protein LOC112574807 isoform X2 [Pomacea canaliculata]|uniref:uncharacterized protein LOC112574807 isoform X2 n=1 Tax=Pomacea canaliculata TaxID=400727 RepID=UPI000D7395C0|nr:uncharacterized protein LOC112574807 isoform X2 [Pomacea canaliculata]
MSSGPPSPSQQANEGCFSPKGGGSSGSEGGGGGREFYSESSGRPGGGGRVKLYLHAVTDAQAASLVNTGNNHPLQEIIMKTGADVQLDPNPSPVPGMTIVIIKGLPYQIEMVVRLITLKTGAQGTISEQAQTFWLQWVEASFPELDSRAYFLPPVYFNRVPMVRQSVAGQDVLVLQSTSGQADQWRKNKLCPPEVALPRPTPVYNSDIREDAAMQRVLFCLKEFSEQNGEVMVGMSQLQFGEYLGEPCYAAAAAQLPVSKTLPNSSSRDRQGDFDVLIIHKLYGFVVCEVKSMGDKINQFTSTDEEFDNTIRKKLLEAVSQLDKAEAMLSHLVSDVCPGLRITKTIAFPNLTAFQTLCRCLQTTDHTSIAGLCLCCDQLSAPKAPCDVSSHVLRELGHWWQRRVAGAGPDSDVTPGVYKTLVAR